MDSTRIEIPRAEVVRDAEDCAGSRHAPRADCPGGPDSRVSEAQAGQSPLAPHLGADNAWRLPAKLAGGWPQPSPRRSAAYGCGWREDGRPESTQRFRPAES